MYLDTNFVGHRLFHAERAVFRRDVDELRRKMLQASHSSQEELERRVAIFSSSTRYELEGELSKLKLKGSKKVKPIHSQAFSDPEIDKVLEVQGYTPEKGAQAIQVYTPTGQSFDLVSIPLIDPEAVEVGAFKRFNGAKEGSNIYLTLDRRIFPALEGGYERVEVSERVINRLKASNRSKHLKNFFQNMYGFTKIDLALEALEEKQAHFSLEMCRLGYEALSNLILAREGIQVTRHDRQVLLKRLKDEGVLNKGEYAQGQGALFSADAAIHQDYLNVSKVNGILAARWIIALAEGTIGTYLLEKNEKHARRGELFVPVSEKDVGAARLFNATASQLHANQRKYLDSDKEKNAEQIADAIYHLFPLVSPKKKEHMNASDNQFITSINYMNKRTAKGLPLEMGYSYVVNAAIFVYSVFNIFHERDLSFLEKGGFIDPNTMTRCYRKGLTGKVSKIRVPTDLKPHMRTLEDVAFPIVSPIVGKAHREFT